MNSIPSIRASAWRIIQHGSPRRIVAAAALATVIALGALAGSGTLWASSAPLGAHTPRVTADGPAPQPGPGCGAVLSGC